MLPETAACVVVEGVRVAEQSVRGCNGECSHHVEAEIASISLILVKDVL